jgi:drug/metabolite transporter (DMT)-like permease
VNVNTTFPRQALGLLVLMTCFWGVNWPLLKVTLVEIAPLHFRSWCFLAGVIGLFSISWASRQDMRVPKGQWGRLIAIAILNMTCWNILAVYGIPMMASGRAAILAYTMPVWGVLFSAWLLGEKLTRRRVAGVLLGMGGMLLLFSTELSSLQRAPLGAMLMIASAVFWALGVVAMKRWPVDIPLTPYIGWQMLIGGIPIFLGALFIEPGSFDLTRLSFWPLIGTIYNMFIAFVFCYWVFTKIALIAPVGVSTLSILMTPIVGVLSGVVFLGETLHWQDMAALVMVLASLATVMLPPGILARWRRPAANDA